MPLIHFCSRPQFLSKQHAELSYMLKQTISQLNVSTITSDSTIISCTITRGDCTFNQEMLYSPLRWGRVSQLRPSKVEYLYQNMESYPSKMLQSQFELIFQLIKVWYFCQRMAFQPSKMGQSQFEENFDVLPNGMFLPEIGFTGF